ncbi:MAG TPA: hypothetical protein VJV04_06360 [Nitrospiraceae bacterium]|nr:hypothetical protein [Nitrospiraceae bacterium]
MTITGKFAGSMLSLIGVVALSLPTFAAESGRQGSSSGGGQVDAQTFQQQRSDKTQQAQDLINQQPMTPQRNTGADLTSGRDSHLGPHDSQGSQMQKKDMKGGSNTGR